MKNSGQLCPDDQQIDAALTTARVFAAESNHLQLLTLYEQRLNRTLQKNLALLQSLQAARKARRETEMQEAARLLQVSEIRGLVYQPAKDGFVFSNTEIHEAIDRQQRFERASETDFTKFRPRKFQTQAASMRE
jgi:LmbE family N-acetylglucosaminyl deacetylase